MKTFKIESAKKLIASFEMDYKEFKMHFKCTKHLVDWIKEQRTEIADCPSSWRCTAATIIVEFYSLGDPVVTEEA